MTHYVEKICIGSDFGDRDYPSRIEISSDGSKPDVPVTFWLDGKATFSMGMDEIEEFCEALKKLIID
jgi:hypothetical protein